jgi:DNA invertase Pin-like site-specific DNA recombinase
MRGTRAIAYIRVSVVGDRALKGRLESPDLQRASIDTWCAQKGVTIIDEIQDLNRSGGTLTRPGLSLALERLQRDDADGIVVAMSSRASRRTVDALGLIDQLERAGKWIAAADGTLDTTTPEAKMATTMFLAVDERQRNAITAQSAIIHRRAILDRGRHMGPAPFGYRRAQDGRLVIHPEEAAVVRLVFERRADGAGWVQIARELDKAGIRQSNGRLVNPYMLRRMARHRVYVGEASHGPHVKPDAHPAIVSEALWRATARVTPPVRSQPSGERAHPDSLLRGLLRCAGCRYVLKRLPQRTDKPPRWSCRTITAERTATHDCPSPVRLRQAEGIEAEKITVAAFMDLAAGLQAEQETSDVDVEAIERRAEQADQMLDELSSLEMRRQLGADRWQRLVSEAREAADTARAEAAAARARTRPMGVANSATLADAWDGMPLPDRQEALRSIVKAVMVAPGDGSLSSRLHAIPTWVSVDLPRTGSRGFRVRPWVPGDH